MSKRTSVKGALLALAIASPAMATESGFSNIYILGDSLSDQGNLFYATEDLTGSGIPANDHYWEGRFANGEIWAGILANRLGISLTPSLSKDGEFDADCVSESAGCGTNFADGGARTDYNRVEADSTKPIPVNFLGQGGYADEDAYPWTLASQQTAFSSREIRDPGALYVVFAGANDLSDLISMLTVCNPNNDFYRIFCTGRGDPSTAIPFILNGINEAIAAFAAAGARDVLVPNMPNLGKIPAITRYDNQDLINLATQLSMQYNQALDEMLAQWTDFVNIIPFDTFSFITDVVNNKEAFGFSNATDTCYNGFVAPGSGTSECDAPDSYVWWDIEHPTTALHAFLADRILDTMVLDMLDYLKLQVSELDVKDKVRDSLKLKLDSASQKFAEGKNADAASKLADFIEKVKEKQGKEIMEDYALFMIMRTEKIIALLDA